MTREESYRVKTKPGVSSEVSRNINIWRYTIHISEYKVVPEEEVNAALQSLQQSVDDGVAYIATLEEARHDVEMALAELD